MASCALWACKNRIGVKKTNGGVTFHKFPNEKCAERRQIWIDFVKRGNWKPTKSSVLCSIHFEEQFIDRTSLCLVRLRDNAVPTLRALNTRNNNDKVNNIPPCIMFKNEENNQNLILPTNIFYIIPTGIVSPANVGSSNGLLPEPPDATIVKTEETESQERVEVKVECETKSPSQERVEVKVECETETTVDVSSESLMEMQKKLDRSTQISNERKRKLILLRRKYCRLEKKIASLKNELANLKKKNREKNFIVQEENSEKLES